MLAGFLLAVVNVSVTEASQQDYVVTLEQAVAVFRNEGPEKGMRIIDARRALIERARTRMYLIDRQGAAYWSSAGGHLKQAIPILGVVGRNPVGRESAIIAMQDTFSKGVGDGAFPVPGRLVRYRCVALNANYAICAGEQ